MPIRFRDRKHAGERLAEALLPLRGENVVVLALPRGGLPIGFEVARALDAPLDIVIVRKLGAPSQPEYGFGAIAPGARYVNEEIVESLGLTRDDIARVEERERRELERRERVYRGGVPPLDVEGRTVVVVDDGVATGGTARAALRSVRARRPRRLLFAAPVGPHDAIDALSAECDGVVLLETPEIFQAVGLWYDRFEQTSDEEVIAILQRARRPPAAEVGMTMSVEEVRIPVDGVQVDATLTIPRDPLGLVIFAHGSGSSRHSPRNRMVAKVLQQRGLATLLLDLLTADEEAVDIQTRELRFDIDLLARRLVQAARWTASQPRTASLPIGYFGSSTGGGAALVAQAIEPESVRAIVSRGGRPDLAGDALGRVTAPTLLLVGGRDDVVIRLNREAQARMRALTELRIVPGATHLFEEPGALEEVAGAAADWFARHLPQPRAAEGREVWR